MQRLLSNFVKRYRGTILRVISLGIIATAAQVLSFVLAIDYISIYLDRAPRLPFVVGWYTSYPDGFLVQVPLLILAGFLSASLLHYAARDINVRTMVLHERVCISELLERIHQAGYLSAHVHALNDIVRTMSRDIRYYGRLIDALLDACLPVVAFTGGGLLLLYLSFSMSIMLFPVICVFLYLFIRLSRTIMQLGLAMEASAKQDAFARRQAIQRALRGQTGPLALSNMLNSVRSDPQINEFLTIYGERLRVSFKAALYSGIFLSLLISGVLFYLGRELVAGRNVIADVIVYIVILNYCLVQVRTLSTVITKIRIFQPFAERYLAFIGSLQRGPAGSASDSFRVQNATLFTGERIADRLYKPGESLGVVMQGSLDKFAVGRICYSLGIPSTHNLAASIVHRYVPDETGGIQRLVETFEKRHPEKLTELDCKELATVVRDELESVRSRFSGSGDEIWENVHRRVGFILQVLESALDEDSNIVFIEGKGFKGIRHQGQIELKRLLQNKVQVLVYPAPPPKPIFGVIDFFSTEEVVQDPEIDLVTELENI